MRADARRNRERLLTCAREVFGTDGIDAPLDEIARRAGVGPGTLYRHFPNRDTLIEAVYRSSIETLAGLAAEFEADSDTPGQAVRRWLTEVSNFYLHQRSLALALKAAIDPTSETFTLCRKLLVEAGGSLMNRAVAAGEIRDDLEPLDLLRLANGIGASCEHSPESADRLRSVMFEGLRVPA
ncbi:TetR/AcrR family transcriptional regulator [Nocardia stercoris]|uniref:TetR/AcrR family transcriptional regulator n=2 Tax=Nocardia stercoris TaxID=2483361 RepID=A0A3M2LEF6_9NOCA|nr:TetR/AcrR family transcriptional regulator [Nocardia stercoris]